MTGLLQRDPQRRLGNHGGDEIKKHVFFARYIDWHRLMAKKIQPPFKPSVVSQRHLVSTHRYQLCVFVSRNPYWTSPTSIRNSRAKWRKTLSSRTPTSPRPFRTNSEGSPITLQTST
jgi:hypothetical protein